MPILHACAALFIAGRWPLLHASIGCPLTISVSETHFHPVPSGTYRWPPLTPTAWRSCLTSSSSSQVSVWCCLGGRDTTRACLAQLPCHLALQQRQPFCTPSGLLSRSPCPRSLVCSSSPSPVCRCACCIIAGQKLDRAALQKGLEQIGYHLAEVSAVLLATNTGLVATVFQPVWLLECWGWC